MTGTVRIDHHTFTLPDDQALELGKAASYVQKKGDRFIAITPDLLIAITPATNISVEVTGAFADYPTSAQIVEKNERQREPRRARVW